MKLTTAIRVQEKLASRLILNWTGGPVRLVAGADAAFDREGTRIGAVVVVMRFPDGEIVDIGQASRRVTMPYVPGFLAFREGPAIFDAFRRLVRRPDVMLLDGNGIAHPRRMGLASYVGVMLDTATIGCAKKPFFPFNPPAERKEAFTFYRDKNQQRVGYCLRTRAGVKPVFVSPGHRVDFPLARRIVLGCSRFRIPEPLRAAHRLSRQMFGF